MVAACTLGRAPSVADCQEAAAFVGFDADVAQLPDGYQTLVRLWAQLGCYYSWLLGQACLLRLTAAGAALSWSPPPLQLTCCACWPCCACCDSLQVGEASRVDLAINARMRLGIARLLLLHRPKLVIIDDADRFFDAVPHFAGALGGFQWLCHVEGCVEGSPCLCTTWDSAYRPPLGPHPPLQRRWSSCSRAARRCSSRHPPAGCRT